jgi:hypothetical protein
LFFIISTPVLPASATHSSPLSIPSSLTQLQSLQEIDFTDNPAPRWGAISGGGPPSQTNTQIQTISWLADGQDATQLVGWDEPWQLEVDGTIAQNIQNAKANWTKQVPADVRRKTGAAGTVLQPLTNPQYSFLSFSGCDNVLEGNATCAGGDAHAVIGTGSGSERWNTIAPCVSARYGVVLAQNHNDLLAQQVFMLFGLTDPNLYDDADPAAHGEIGVLNVDQGVWSPPATAPTPASASASAPPRSASPNAPSPVRVPPSSPPGRTSSLARSMRQIRLCLGAATGMGRT